MNKKKDQERAEQGERHISGKKVQAEPPKQCPVEGCTRLVSPMSKIGLCHKCSEIAAVLVWVLPRLRAVPRTIDQPSVLVPKPGMGDKAVKEAQAASKLIIPGGNR